MTRVRAVPDSSPSEKIATNCNFKPDDSDQVLTLLTNRPAGDPARGGRFRRGRAFHPALRNPPELRAELLIALAPLPRLFQNSMMPYHDRGEVLRSRRRKTAAA
jgi:hypothetical protein